MVFGNGYINNAIDDNTIIIEICTEISIPLSECIILEDGTVASECINFRINGKDIKLYVRTKNTGRSGMPIKHGASVKIRSPKFNGEDNIPIDLPSDDDGEFKIDSLSSKTVKEVKRSGILDIVKHNRSALYSIYFCKDIDEYNKLIERMVNDEYNKKYKISRSENKKQEPDS